MYKINDIVDVYQARTKGRKTAFLFTGKINEIDISNGLYYVIPINPVQQIPGRWTPDWTLVLIKSIVNNEQNDIKAYERAMSIL